MCSVQASFPKQDVQCLGFIPAFHSKYSHCPPSPSPPRNTPCTAHLAHLAHPYTTYKAVLDTGTSLFAGPSDAILPLLDRLDVPEDCGDGDLYGL